MGYCPDCGCRMYNGACTNCHEEIYIEQQCYEIGMEVPESISTLAAQQRETIKQRKREQHE